MIVVFKTGRSPSHVGLIATQKAVRPSEYSS
jgi:hypothetical protein